MTPQLNALYCACVLAVRLGAGAGRPALRGLAVGFGGGVGAGMGLEQCNNQFRILQGQGRAASKKSE